MFYQLFFSPQVKRCAILTYKHGLYELPNELPNDLRLRSLKTSKNGSLVPSVPAKMRYPPHLVPYANTEFMPLMT